MQLVYHLIPCVKSSLFVIPGVVSVSQLDTDTWRVNLVVVAELFCCCSVTFGGLILNQCYQQK